MRSDKSKKTSKYDGGAYHYWEFSRPTTYRRHVLDLMDVVVRHVPSGASILDVGAGEGLIMSELVKRGFKATGCDTDPLAVLLSLEMKNDVILGTISDFVCSSFAAVLLCDVLEHVHDPLLMLKQASEAGVVVVAIPDREDKHAVNKLRPEDIIYSLSPTHVLKHSDTRHARHLMVFKRD